jgi:hypothetical protein
MIHPGDDLICLQVLPPGRLPSNLQALLHQCLRLTRTNGPTFKKPRATGQLLEGRHFEPLFGLIVAIIVGAVWQVYRDDQTKELIKTWGQSSLIWASSVLGTTQRSSELAAEPGSTLSEKAVTPTPVAIGEIPELQLQLQTMVGDLAVLQRIVEQVASKQEQISRDIATLQATEQNINEKISSLTQAAAVHAPPRRNVAKLVHSETPKQPAASPLPLEIPPAETPSVAAIPPAAETPSPANQPPRPPLPLTQPVGTPSAAH